MPVHTHTHTHTHTHKHKREFCLAVNVFIVPLCRKCVDSLT